jgi:putative membrane protein
MDFFPFGGFIFLLLWFVLFCAAAGLVAYFVIPAIIQKVRHDSAIVILEQRFARGEIDSEEFKKRRQDLLTR